MSEAMEIMRAAVVRTFPHWDPATITLEPLSGGITNQNAIVSVSSLAPQRFVVRLPGERTELLGIDRAHEVEATQRAAALGISPAVFGDLDGIGTVVTEFVAGTHLEPAEFVGRLDEVVGMIALFHGSGALAGEFPIHRVVEWHARDAVALGATLPAAYPELLELSLRIEAEFATASDAPVACHNDLLPNNVLFGRDRMWLLDFEYAGMNDRYFDLANLSVNCAFDVDVDERLLTLYFGNATEHHRRRLTLMKVMSEFREGMWAVVQQVISTLETDFVTYADERLANALLLSASCFDNDQA